MSRSDARVPYPLGVVQKVAYSGTQGRTSSGVGEQTRFVTVYCSTDAYYRFGDSSVAATVSNGNFLPAGNEHFVRIRAGEYVSAIQDSAGGNLIVSEFGS